MKTILLLMLSCMISLQAFAQYEFSNQKTVDCTVIKNQNKTGTCWSFATASFLESELIRKGHDDIDLSEMFVVRSIYQKKAKNYVLRQGKANFSQGSLAHDLINTLGEKGLVPDAVYSGKSSADEIHNHSEMENALKGFLDGVIKTKRLSNKWSIAFDKVLDVYLGEMPSKFNYKGAQYNPKSFAEKLGLDANEFVHLTSFTHHPFGSSFILEIPDNFSNGSFYNMPIDELVQNLDHALDNGFTIAWDGDVSEKGFDAKKGIAVLPSDEKRENLFTQVGAEIEVDQAIRQTHFESYSTTDDHLMHIIGTAKDQEGNKYYIIKNSWGPIGPYEGQLYMSEAYFRMKTVSITLNKEGLKSKMK